MERYRSIHAKDFIFIAINYIQGLLKAQAMCMLIACMTAYRNVEETFERQFIFSDKQQLIESDLFT